MRKPHAPRPEVYTGGADEVEEDWGDEELPEPVPPAASRGALVPVAGGRGAVSGRVARERRDRVVSTGLTDRILSWASGSMSRSSSSSAGLKVEPGATAAFVARLYIGVGEKDALGFSGCTDAHSSSDIPSANMLRSYPGLLTIARTSPVLTSRTTAAPVLHVLIPSIALASALSTFCWKKTSIERYVSRPFLASWLLIVDTYSPALFTMTVL